MATSFPRTLQQQQPPPQPAGPVYVDEYAPQIEALRAKLAQPPAPMFTPEQIAQRRADNQREYAMGMLGQLSGDEALANVGGQVFKKALADRTQRVTERGTSDPITGAFSYSPDYVQQRDQAAMTGLETKSAAGKAAFAEARRQEDLKRELSADKLENQRALRAIGAAASASKGSGVDDARRFRGEDTLRGDFDRITKDTREEIGAAQKLKTTIHGYVGRPLDAQAQQAVVILLNKFLDPGSVVREGEFDRVVKAQGLEAQALNYINRLRTGEFMTPKAVQQIGYLAEVYEKAGHAKMRNTAKNYDAIARGRGFDASAVISDPQYLPRPEVSNVVDVGAAVGRPGAAAKPQAFPKSNPKPAAGGNTVRQADW